MVQEMRESARSKNLADRERNPFHLISSLIFVVISGAFKTLRTKPWQIAVLSHDYFCVVKNTVDGFGTCNGCYKQTIYFEKLIFGIVTMSSSTLCLFFFVLFYAFVNVNSYQPHAN